MDSSIGYKLNVENVKKIRVVIDNKTIQSSSNTSKNTTRVFTPLLLCYTDFTSGLENSEICLKLYQLSFFCFFCLKITFLIRGDRFLLTLNISITRDWIFLMWIEREPSFSSSSFLVRLFMLVNNTQASLMKPFYFPIICAIVVLPNKGKIAKLGIKKAFISIILLGNPINGAILAKVSLQRFYIYPKYNHQNSPSFLIWRWVIFRTYYFQFNICQFQLLRFHYYLLVTDFFQDCFLTHFSPMSHFYTTWKRQKTIGFLTFSGVIEMWHWTKMDYEIIINQLE